METVPLAFNMTETDTWPTEASSDHFITQHQLSPDTGNDENSSNGAMLSVDFSAPLSGAARAERIKQMTSAHVSRFTRWSIDRC